MRTGLTLGGGMTLLTKKDKAIIRLLDLCLLWELMLTRPIEMPVFIPVKNDGEWWIGDGGEFWDVADTLERCGPLSPEKLMEAKRLFNKPKKISRDELIRRLRA